MEVIVIQFGSLIPGALYADLGSKQFKVPEVWFLNKSTLQRCNLCEGMQQLWRYTEWRNAKYQYLAGRALMVTANTCFHFSMAPFWNGASAPVSYAIIVFTQCIIIEKDLNFSNLMPLSKWIKPPSVLPWPNVARNKLTISIGGSFDAKRNSQTYWFASSKMSKYEM